MPAFKKSFVVMSCTAVREADAALAEEHEMENCTVTICNSDRRLDIKTEIDTEEMGTPACKRRARSPVRSTLWQTI